jgi:putative ABC transport system permease protein
VRALDRDLPVDRMKSMEQVVSDSVTEARLMSSILGGFGVFALGLAALGIYGLIAYSVNQRTHEIGIRVALGASSGSVLASVLQRGALLGLAGVAIGAPIALAVSPLIGSLLYGVKPRDLGVFLGVSVVLMAAALAASYVPARRAAKVNPMEALKYE